MRCIEIKQPGGPEVLVLTERPVPSPQAGEVLIAVRAAGVNRPDVVQRLGHYPPPPGASDIPGLEIAGTVVAVGDGVTTPGIGEQVCALIAGGGYAEYASAPAGCCLPIPEGIDFIGAAAIPETFFTVWHNVFERGALKSGESLLVHGGSSGIGTTAIQLAKLFGATVVATAGSDEKCKACRQLGADLAINYKTADFVAEIKAKLPGKGVDLVLDMVGGDYVARNIAVLKADGRLVNIAHQNGAKVSLDLMPVMLKRLTLTGSTLRVRDVAFKSALAAALRAKVWPMIARGLVRPLIDQTFPLGEAAAAHTRLESSQHIGKIVLTTR
jgi:putative PIG3 family NAD(P)H quinone oxidoreductase